ncbi:MAG: hypothetical protein K2X47_12635 [Bdellovibrionales bacterium]|nr:hypothetical protein [Bdellovibrionales bacterium]
MEKRNLTRLRRLTLFTLSVLAFLFFQPAFAHPRSVTLTGRDAEILYRSLSSVPPQGPKLAKHAYITFIQQYDGPGPFSYLMVYSPQEDRSKTFRIDFPENMTKQLESLSEALYLDDKGLTVQGNPPHHTQTVTDAFATCALTAVVKYTCVVSQ